MIDHLVFLKFKDGTTQEAKTKVVNELTDLKSKLSFVKEITSGINFTDRSKGYEVGLLVRLQSREDLVKYREHPLHIEVLDNYIKPYLADIIVLDYEV